MTAHALITQRIYQKLLRLAPDLRELRGSAFSGLPGYRKLSIDVNERSGDRLRIKLSHYCLYPSGERVRDPTLEVAVFLDRQEAVALSYEDAFRQESVADATDEIPDREVQARLNQFLESWLDRLHDFGHVARNGG